MGGLHHRVFQRLMGWNPTRRTYGTWVYPPLSEVMAEEMLLAMVEEGIQEVETYVTILQNTVKQYIDTRPIMDLCLEVERLPGIRVLRRRWEQE